MNVRLIVHSQPTIIVHLPVFGILPCLQQLNPDTQASTNSFERLCEPVLHPVEVYLSERIADLEDQDLQASVTAESTVQSVYPKGPLVTGTHFSEGKYWVLANC